MWWSVWQHRFAGLEAMETAENKVEQSELDRGSEGMWLSLNAIWSLWVKTCHELSLTSD